MKCDYCGYFIGDDYNIVQEPSGKWVCKDCVMKIVIEKTGAKQGFDEQGRPILIGIKLKKLEEWREDLERRGEL